MTSVRIIGVGQRFAGDDGVGLAVLDALRGQRLPPGTELLVASEAAGLIELLAGCERAIVVDAVVGGGAPGTVLALAPDALAGRQCSASSHGLGVSEAIALACVLGNVTPRIDLVAVVIAPPRVEGPGLSPRVRAGVQRAARRIRALLGAPG